MEIIKVSSGSKPAAVAGAIASVMRTDGGAEVRAVGAGAVNQAVKSIAIARGYLKGVDMDMVCYPEFCTSVIGGEERTSMSFICFDLSDNLGDGTDYEE